MNSIDATFSLLLEGPDFDGSAISQEKAEEKIKERRIVKVEVLR